MLCIKLCIVSEKCLTLIYVSHQPELLPLYNLHSVRLCEVQQRKTGETWSACEIKLLHSILQVKKSVESSPQDADFVSTSFTLRVSLRILLSVLSTRCARSSMISKRQKEKERGKRKENVNKKFSSVLFYYLSLLRFHKPLFFPFYNIDLPICFV